MKLLIFTVTFFLWCLVPPLLKWGIYSNESGRMLYNTPYILLFLVFAFLFLHELIHHFGGSSHKEVNEYLSS
jgi:hypothetical protein